jgi:cystathionine beta-lyase
VADMDFRAPRPVVRAIMRRAAHGVFGYTRTRDSCGQAVADWMKKRHGWSIKKEWLVFTPGIVPALNYAVLAYTRPGDRVLIQPPVYRPFFAAVRNHGRTLVLNKLIEHHGRYTIDFSGLERKFAAGVKLMIFCSPHNPVGRVWRADELRTLARLCRHYRVTLVSDEIHADVVYPGHCHVPIGRFLPAAITCMAPSKTFNVAGLQASVLIVPRRDLREQIAVAMHRTGLHSLNVFGLTALEAAYRHGGPWLARLLRYLHGNVDFLESYLARRIPHFTLIRPEGTFLAWLDCRRLGLAQPQLMDLMLRRAKVALEDGTIYGPGGRGFVRINLGCPRTTLRQALRRMEKAVRRTTKNSRDGVRPSAYRFPCLKRRGETPVFLLKKFEK